MSKPTDLVQGTLDLLILKIIALEPMHGWAIAQRIRQMSGEVLQVGQGALYPSLHKLEQNGWISSEWAISENNRRAKYYTLTQSGHRRAAILAAVGMGFGVRAPRRADRYGPGLGRNAPDNIATLWYPGKRRDDVRGGIAGSDGSGWCGKLCAVDASGTDRRFDGFASGMTMPLIN